MASANSGGQELVGASGVVSASFITIGFQKASYYMLSVYAKNEMPDLPRVAYHRFRCLIEEEFTR